MCICKCERKGWQRGAVRTAAEEEGRTERRGGRGALPCRLHGIKTCEIYSSLDWSGPARFGVACTKKEGGTHIAGNERRGDVAATLRRGCAAFLFADFNIKTVPKERLLHDLFSDDRDRPATRERRIFLDNDSNERKSRARARASSGDLAG